MPYPLLLAALVAAQPISPPVASPGAVPQQQYGRSFMSPMGEPFFGRVAGEDGLTAWFRQADLNHDGSITADEMTADARRFFEILDTDHDGEIGPGEIDHYEQVIAPQVRNPSFHGAPPVEAGLSTDSGRGGRHGGKRRHGGGDFAGIGAGGDDEASAGRYGLLQIPEPVMSADADFNRGVSKAEFDKAAVERFQLLDVNRSGRLSLPELEGIRGAAASAARHPPRPKSEDTPMPPPDEGDDQSPPM